MHVNRQSGTWVLATCLKSMHVNRQSETWVLAMLETCWNLCRKIWIKRWELTKAKVHVELPVGIHIPHVVGQVVATLRASPSSFWHGQHRCRPWRSWRSCRPWRCRPWHRWWCRRQCRGWLWRWRRERRLLRHHDVSRLFGRRWTCCNLFGCSLGWLRRLSFFGWLHWSGLLSRWRWWCRLIPPVVATLEVCILLPPWVILLPPWVIRAPLFSGWSSCFFPIPLLLPWETTLQLLEGFQGADGACRERPRDLLLPLVHLRVNLISSLLGSKLHRLGLQLDQFITSSHGPFFFLSSSLSDHLFFMSVSSATCSSSFSPSTTSSTLFFSSLFSSSFSSIIPSTSFFSSSFSSSICSTWLSFLSSSEAPITSTASGSASSTASSAGTASPTASSCHERSIGSCRGRTGCWMQRSLSMCHFYIIRSGSYICDCHDCWWTIKYIIHECVETCGNFYIADQCRDSRTEPCRVLILAGANKQLAKKHVSDSTVPPPQQDSMQYTASLPSQAPMTWHLAWDGPPLGSPLSKM